MRFDWKSICRLRQRHRTGLHDGCSAVQCIQVYAPYFYSLNHYLMCPLLQMFWNRNNGPSSPVCSAAAVPVCEPSSFFSSAFFRFTFPSILHMSNCRFQSRAKAHGVAHAPVQLVHGDFLKNSDVNNAISSAGLVFANNPRFGPKLNMEILCTLVPLMQKGSKLVCFDDCGLDQWDALKFVKMIHVPRGGVSWDSSTHQLYVLKRL